MRWKIGTYDAELVRQMCQTTGVAPVIAQVLARRDVTHPSQVESFLETRLTSLEPPMSLPGVARAIPVILDAIQNREKIFIYGDYDCDGITATAIMYDCLRLLGGDVHYFVPNRVDDGYGLSCDQLQKLKGRGANLVITVDCGIASIAEARMAAELGLRLIITDHHHFGSELPEAAALVHPKLPGSDYPFRELCGAGVAFKLAWALCQARAGSEKLPEPMRNFLFRAIAWATLGTIADVVPLLGENRILVHHGLKLLPQHGGLGFQALAREAKVHDKRSLTAEDIAFFIAPRINASGRLCQAQLGVELLISDSATKAEELAAYIHNLNRSRDSLERGIIKEAQKQIDDKFDPANDGGLVLANRGWHQGVIGIVAGRLAEKYHVPTVVISFDDNSDRPGTGSARSAGGIDLYQVLGQCQSHLVGFGGHSAAAGVKIHFEQVEVFRQSFCEAVSEITGTTSREAELEIDVEAALCQLNLDTVTQLERLAPFGNSNPRPILCATGVRLAAAPKTMGSDGRHVDLRVEQDNVQLRAVAFGKAEWVTELAAAPDQLYDFAFKPVINEFRGAKNVELQLVDFRRQRSAS